LNVRISKETVRKALRHPKLVWLWAKGYGEVELSQKHIEHHLEDVSKMKIDAEGSDPLEIVCRAIDLCSKSCYHTQYLYLVCRSIRPSKVVETGVHYGASSAFILQALQECGGRLYSIDLPNVKYKRDNGICHDDALPRGLQPGFVVPKWLKANWELTLGDSRKKLPELLLSISNIDMFHHDSMHTYDLMTFEFETAWPYLKHDGLLLADDADWNDAFKDFSNRHSLTYTIHKGIGIAKKI